MIKLLFLKKIGVNILLSLASVVFIFLIIETTSRWILPAAPEIKPGFKNRIHEFSPNPKLFYKPSPGAESFVYHVDNKINSHGFRDREYPVKKPAGTKRIVFLGDSVVYGYGLELEQTLPKQIERLFSESSQRVEVLNFGVSGYETQQQIEFLKETALKFSPDMVLVGYTLNDSNYASWELDTFHTEFTTNIKRDGRKLRHKLWAWIYKNSRFMSWLDKRLSLQQKYKRFRSYTETEIYSFIAERNKSSKDPLDSEYRSLEKNILADAKQRGTSEKSVQFLLGILGFHADDIHSSHWNISEQSFGELRDLSKKHGFSVGVVIFPIFQEMDRYVLESIHHFIAKRLKGFDFNVLDLSEWGKKIYAEHGRPAVSGDSIHMTPLSAASASTEIFTWLKKQPLATEKP